MGVWRRSLVGVEAITPLQAARIKRLSQCFQVLGLVFAGVAVGLLGYWYWWPFFVFSIIVLLVDLVGTHQLVCRLESFEVVSRV